MKSVEFGDQRRRRFREERGFELEFERWIFVSKVEGEAWANLWP